MDEMSNMSDVNDVNESTSPIQTFPLDLSQFHQIFSQFAPQDVEQFQLLYQHWAIQQQINDVQQQIDVMQRQLAETVAQIEHVHPSAVALASLARLQASGVEDIDLLDRMLERGEEWLDRTIQHLEYCEQLDVIRGDYEEWCRHALEDAFEWLDSMQSDTSITPHVHTPVHEPAQPPPTPASGGETTAGETTEAIFLQKLMSEEAAHGGNDGDDEAETGNDAMSEEARSDVPAAAPTTPVGDTDIGAVLEETTLKVPTIQTTGEDQDNAEEKIRGEDNAPHVQKESAHKRSNFVQRFLSHLWP